MWFFVDKNLRTFINHYLKEACALPWPPGGLGIRFIANKLNVWVWDFFNSFRPRFLVASVGLSLDIWPLPQVTSDAQNALAMKVSELPTRDMAVGHILRCFFCGWGLANQLWSFLKANMRCSPATGTWGFWLGPGQVEKDSCMEHRCFHQRRSKDSSVKTPAVDHEFSTPWPRFRNATRGPIAKLMLLAWGFFGVLLVDNRESCLQNESRYLALRRCRKKNHLALLKGL